MDGGEEEAAKWARDVWEDQSPVVSVDKDLYPQELVIVTTMISSTKMS